MVKTIFKLQLASAYPKFKDVVFFVEADSFARHQLWAIYSGEWYKEPESNKIVRWKQGDGMSSVIGTIDGQSINVEFTFAYINNYLICFYSPISSLVDWDMVSDFMSDTFKKYKSQHCNTENFHHCLQELERIEKFESMR